MDTFARTAFRTLHTSDTLRIIYCRKVIIKTNRAFGTGAFALTATDTPHLADIHHFLALSRIRTRDIDLGGFGYAPYYLFGTGGNAFTARRTVVRRHFRRARILAYRYGVISASRHARTQSHATVFARFVAACQYLRAFTISEPLIIVLISRAVAACAMHYSHSSLAVEGAHAQYFRDVLFIFRRRRIATRNIRFALKQRLGELRTSGITASAAVCAR